jgi:hypothetical protein
MWFAAERPDLPNSMAELCEIAGGRDHVLAEAAGITVSFGYAWPSNRSGL